MLDNDAIETGSQSYIRARAVLFRWKERSCLWTNYAVAPIFQHSLWDCADCSEFGMLRKAGRTFINLPWLESPPVHNLPSFPPPAYRASLLLKLVNPWTKVVNTHKKVHWQAINEKHNDKSNQMSNSFYCGGNRMMLRTPAYLKDW